MNLLRKVVSMVLHGLASLFVFYGEVIALLSLPGQGTKVWMTRIFLLVAAIMFGIAIAIGNFASRFKPVGIGMLCASAANAFLLLCIFSMLSSPEILDVLARQGVPFNRYLTRQGMLESGGLTAVIAAFGWMIARRRRLSA
ncbi:hypothetical protein CY652_04610 [Burkholderia sp. WAC0059]|uniref:hypothetical protein n=1 Tax=Burkholderia sp. WAC0059 TaxID=2066022 RepID=UPI000C7EACF8|nr:hypothetical protein [Burkholderia sp. WAC0059]PLZ03671.1 hypothetical protein CY652_04610 [Burkholderia sp. WAC0059]